MKREKMVYSKGNRAITLIALIVTIIVLLILAGVTINLAVNNQGIFNKAKTATRAYKNATEDERTGLDEADKEIAKYMPKEGSEGGSSSGSETTGNDPLKNTDRTIDDLNKDEGDSNKDGVVDTKDDLRGFYIDLNNDGNLDTTNDGVIFGDLLTGGKGVYWCHTTEGIPDDEASYWTNIKSTLPEGMTLDKFKSMNFQNMSDEEISKVIPIKSNLQNFIKYTIPTKSTLSTYEIIKDSNGNIKKFDGPFGSRGMLQRKTAVTNGDRFYVMALGDIDNNGHTWYKNAVGKMNDYSTYTSTEFGQGKENTRKMIARGNNNGKDPYDSNNTSDYGAISDSDVWKAIPSLVDKGWFVPSRDEWNAFGAFFRVGGEFSNRGMDNKTYTFTDYYDYNTVYKLSDWCWASSQGNTYRAYNVIFFGGTSDFYIVNGIGSVRLGSTF